MVRVTDEYSFEEICNDYIGGDLILALPSNIFFAIEKWVEHLSDGEIDFTNKNDGVFLPSRIYGCLSKVDLYHLKDIDIDYKPEDDGSFDEEELRDLFECQDYYYLGIDDGNVYYFGD